MPERRTYRLLWAGFLPITIGLLLVTAFLAGNHHRSALEDIHRDRLRLISTIGLHSFPDKALVNATAADPFRTEDTEALRTWCEQTAQTGNAAVAVYSVGSDTPVAASAPFRTGGPNPVLRESNQKQDILSEHSVLQTVFDGEVAFGVRGSGASETSFQLIPIRDAGLIVGALEVGISYQPIRAAMRRFHGLGLLLSLTFVLTLGTTFWILSQRLDHQLSDLDRRIVQFSRSETERPSWTASGGLTDLLELLDQTEETWTEQVRTLTRRCAEQDALLGSMVESVLAVDPDGKILSLNPAAARLLGVSPESALQHSFDELAPHPNLSRFVAQTLNSLETIEEEVLIGDTARRYLRAQGTMLRDPEGRRSGALLVLQDVTHLRQLETVRRDFVANVSHELKTPITSIKGFAETLREGALTRSGEAHRFVEIILNQANRLQAIIEDLLSLSQIEQSGRNDGIRKEWTQLREILEIAVQTCLPKTQEARAMISLECDEALTGRVSAPLLEEAVVNLIDNAVKYSDPGRHVRIQAYRARNEIIISVDDQGHGISVEHLPRLFERFYRVDKARSRKAGGTGLGLAIVKHIALAHGGNVRVESEPGKGSRFEIHLPATGEPEVEITPDAVDRLEASTATDSSPEARGENPPAGSSVPPPAASSSEFS